MSRIFSSTVTHCIGSRSRCERFLALSDDPEFYVGIVAPDIEHYYFAPLEVRKAAFELWGI